MVNASRRDDEGVSPWIRTHEREFRGKLSPFGSKVYFKSTTWGQKKKFEDSAIVGVSAGYEMTAGYGWSGIYLVWKL